MKTETHSPKKTIHILLRQPFTESSEVEANLIAQCVSEIERIDGHFAHLNFLGGDRAQSNDSFRKSFERKVGSPFTPQNFRKYRLSLLRNADAFINLRTGMSESTAFEVAYNLFGGHSIPMFFAVWSKAPIKTTLIRDLQDLGDVTYSKFNKPRDLRRPLWDFLERVCRGKAREPSPHSVRQSSPLVYGADVKKAKEEARKDTKVQEDILTMGNLKRGHRWETQRRYTGVLVLADGQTFWGQGIGVEGKVTGELCFNTAMTGYQEILSDPSYAGQIVTFSFPHIGNTGVNEEDMETLEPLACGCVLRDPIAPMSNYRATSSLTHWLEKYKMIGLTHVDTREITQLLREKGVQNCVIAHSKEGLFDTESFVVEAAQAASLVGQDLAARATVKDSFEVKGSEGYDSSQRKRVVVVDYGVKGNIVNCLIRRGLDVTVLPAKASSKDIMACRPDGILLSNGPGDPVAVAPYTVPMIESLLQEKLPLFGICLGHQLLALALGSTVSKMHFGHHGANHPILDKTRGRVLITSQNHGFVVNRDSLPKEAMVTHVSLFDGTLAGFEMPEEQILSVQFHPEASPGPHDAESLFDRFADRVRQPSLPGMSLG